MTDPKPTPVLDRMTFDDLIALCNSLFTLRAAGEAVVGCGLPAPTFRLAPGQPFHMMLAKRMPHTATSMADEEERKREHLSQIYRILSAPVVPAPEQTADNAGAQETAEAPEAGAAGDGGGQLAAPAPAVEQDPEMPEPLPAGAGDEGMATTDPAEAVVAPTPFISPLKSGPLAEDEKADIIRRAREGQSVDEIAEAIGRRKNVVATVVYQAQKHGNEPEPQPPLPTAAAEPATGAAVSPAPVAHPDASLSPIEVHLHSQPRKGGWTTERDHELLSLICAGWAMPEISAEMKVPAGDLKARFDLLTGLHRDANDKPARRWTREALLAALTPWVQSQAAE